MFVTMGVACLGVILMADPARTRRMAGATASR